MVHLHHNQTFFFFNDPAPTEIYTLSLHDALPISCCAGIGGGSMPGAKSRPWPRPDRKSTRLNSSHRTISYAVFCLKKKSKREQALPRSRSDQFVARATTDNVILVVMGFWCLC